jgi:adenosylcobyric acid synthase
MALARTLMVQGTASSAGKSFVATALCRHFARKGLSVAPFKALNMALNAYVTSDGRELARAQAVQAEAAGVAPSVEMNPILLKPTGPMQSQLVLHGKAVATLSARELFASGIDLRGAVVEALGALRARHDLVILEGAGSPAEVNLRARDVANMFAARAADAPVLLVGDIDRGGVLAAFAGTLALLTAEERVRVRGLIVNKFRGDRSLLEPGLAFLHEHTGVPVLGVLPHLGAHGLAEEDSLDVDARVQKGGARADLDVYVLRLPHLSNHDEFQPLEHEPGVSLGFGLDLTRALEADLLIVPGSKSTVHDLGWLRAQGFDHVLALRARREQPVLGICGGCQMLGRLIRDEHGVESAQRETVGLGLLPLVTEFEPNKRTERVGVRRLAPSFLGAGHEAVDGYFIHAGRSRREAGEPLFTVRSAEGDSEDGARSVSGAVLGTMVHGLFEDEGFRRAALDALRERKGLPALAERARTSRMAAYDRVADALAEHADMAAIERLVGV